MISNLTPAGTKVVFNSRYRQPVERYNKVFVTSASPRNSAARRWVVTLQGINERIPIEALEYAGRHARVK